MWFFAANPSLPPLPPWYLYSFTFLMGAIVGSFLNVCILRIPEEGVSIFYPRNSRCPQCGYSLRWYDNVPVLSWLFLRGQCRSCKNPISLQYPLVELVTAVLAVAVVKRFDATLAALILFIFVCALIVITFIDMAYWIIPDVISLPAIPLGILAALWIGPPLPTWQEAVWGAVLGGGIFLSISLTYEFIMKRPGLGMGDVKLLAMIGAFLGWKAIPSVILLASAQGLIAAILLYFLGWRKGVPDIYEDEDSDQLARPTEDGQTTEDSGSEALEARPEDASEATTEEVQEQEETSSDEPSIAEAAGDGSAIQEDLPSGELEEEGVGFRAVAIQFGPFLCLAALETLFWGKQIMLWYIRLFQF